MSKPQEAYDAAKVSYNLTEKKIDQAMIAACEALKDTIMCQRACADDANDPIHGTKFASTKAALGDVIKDLATAQQNMAAAHALGDCACEGGPIAQGGGGGK